MASAIVQAVTVADLLSHLGGIPAARVRMQPTPGTATETDVLTLYRQEKRLYELVDGVLVEKTVGYYESIIAATLIRLLGNFVTEHDLGVVAGADGLMRLAPGLVRIPDVSLVSWERLPGRRVPRQPIPDLVPNLAIEVLSASNTVQEMHRKLDEYFTLGVDQVWLVNPATASLAVYTARHQVRMLERTATLEGSAFLAGFTLPLQQLFAED